MRCFEGTLSKSEGGALYYTGEKDFISKLHNMETSDELRLQMGEKGKRYVAKEYDWNIIMGRLKQAIERIG